MDDRAYAAAQEFLLAAKMYWTRDLHGALKAEYEDLAAGQGAPPSSPQAVADLLEGRPLYQYFAWFERHLQRQKYSGRYGLTRLYDARRQAALATLADSDDLGPLLRLDDALPLPAYYRRTDIHQHPGGVWSDETAGLVYEHGSRTTTPLIKGDHKTLHDRFTEAVARGGDAGEILDMGCGFGKSTEPFYERFRDARVEAIDLSAPCLRLAATNAARSQASNVRYSQMNACATAFQDDRFDLVTSTMLLHELPGPQIEALVAEAHRVLAPGGRMVHLDFFCIDDAFDRFLYFGHGRRNNEPFMEPLAKMDLQALLEGKGFRDVSIAPFDELGEEAPAELRGHWRFPWTVISAVKA